MHCPKCNYEVFALFGKKFCVKCGTQLVIEPTQYCMNPTCSKYIEIIPFIKNPQYCGECGQLLSVENEME